MQQTIEHEIASLIEERSDINMGIGGRQEACCNESLVADIMAGCGPLSRAY